MLYSFKTAYPQKLPKLYENHSQNELTELGFKIVDFPPDVTNGNFLDWDGQNWYLRLPNEAETQFQWQQIREKRNKLLQESDVYIIKLYENELPVPENIKTYRQELRDITLQADPWNIVWPIFPNIQL